MATNTESDTSVSHRIYNMIWHSSKQQHSLCCLFVLLCIKFYCEYFIEYDITHLWVTAGFGHTTIWVRTISYSSWAIYSASIILLSFHRIQDLPPYSGTTVPSDDTSPTIVPGTDQLYDFFILDRIARYEAMLFHKFQAVRQTTKVHHSIIARLDHTVKGGLRCLYTRNV